jgi:hypothetical protein
VKDTLYVWALYLIYVTLLICPSFELRPSVLGGCMSLLCLHPCGSRQYRLYALILSTPMSDMNEHISYQYPRRKLGYRIKT